MGSTLRSPYFGKLPGRSRRLDTVLGALVLANLMQVLGMCQLCTWTLRVSQERSSKLLGSSKLLAAANVTVRICNGLLGY